MHGVSGQYSNASGGAPVQPQLRFTCREVARAHHRLAVVDEDLHAGAIEQQLQMRPGRASNGVRRPSARDTRVSCSRSPSQFSVIASPKAALNAPCGVSCSSAAPSA